MVLCPDPASLPSFGFATCFVPMWVSTWPKRRRPSIWTTCRSYYGIILNGKHKIKSVINGAELRASKTLGQSKTCGDSLLGVPAWVVTDPWHAMNVCVPLLATRRLKWQTWWRCCEYGDHDKHQSKIGFFRNGRRQSFVFVFSTTPSTEMQQPNCNWRRNTTRHLAWDQTRQPDMFQRNKPHHQKLPPRN